MKKKFLLIDESGDPNFYGHRKKLLVSQPGYQPYLMIGMIETEDRRALHEAVVKFLNEIKSDPLYNTIPSVIKDSWYVHARGDHPEIRAKFFELLRRLEGFKAHIVTARKDILIFNRKHNNNPTEFYFDVLYHLLNGRLNDPEYQYMIYLSQRDNSNISRLQEAVNRALQTGNSNVKKISCHLRIVPGKEMPELSIVDYLMWAFQRKLMTEEHRQFDALIDKFATIINLYE
ncbi:MAG: DUF3800 domain-containing protein [Bacteroidota bacterium]